MNFRKNKTTPHPFPENVEIAQPLATKVKLDPVLLDLIANLKEKKVSKSKTMRLSD
jgi:hypothetical protein